MTRVLVVTNSFPPRGKWGTEFYTKELVSGLAARGHELAVMHPERSGSRPRYSQEQDEVDGIPIHLIHNAGDPKKSFEDSYINTEVERIFVDLIKRTEPDVVHFTYLLWGLSSRLPIIASELGYATVVTLTDYGLLCHRGQMFDHRLEHCHGPHPARVCARCVREPSIYDGTPSEVVGRRVAVRAAAALGGLGRVVTTRGMERREVAMRASLSAARRVIAPSRVLAENFLSYGVPRERMVELVYSFAEEPWRSARSRPQEEQHVFAYIGQFMPHKGLEPLLEAVALMQGRLPESVSPWELRLYGGSAGGRNRSFGPRLLGRDHGPRVTVREAFEPKDAPAVLAEVSTLVVPSLWDENAPLVVLQGRAAGIPVVGSDVPGISEIVDPELHGVLVPPGDAAALADALRGELLAGRRRTSAPGLPLGLSEHLDRIEEIHQAVLAE